MNYRHLILCICLSWQILALAEKSKPFFDTLPFLLPSGTPMASTFIDRENRLWFGLSAGSLIRYNGSDQPDEYPFWTRYIHINVDLMNRIWTEKSLDGNTAPLPIYFDLTAGQIHTVRFIDEAKHYLDNKDTFALNNNSIELWLLADSGDLYKADITQKIHDVVIFSKQAHIQLANADLAATEQELTLDEQGNVWIGLHQQIIKYDPKTQQTTDYSAYFQTEEGLSLGVIATRTAQGTTWVATKHLNQLLRIDSQGKVKVIMLPDRIYDLQGDEKRHTVWLTTITGLYFIHGEEEKLHFLDQEVWQDAGLNSSSIRDLSLDQDDNLWLTTGKGIRILRGIDSNMKRITPNLYQNDNKINLQLQHIRFVTLENASILWWINRQQDLVRYDKNTGEEHVFPTPFGKTKDNIPDRAESLVTSYPYLLISTYLGKLLRFDTRTNTFLPPFTIDESKLPHGGGFMSSLTKNTDKFWLDAVKTRLETLWKVQDVLVKEFTFWDTKTNALKPFACKFPQFSEIVQRVSKIQSYADYRDTLWIIPKDITGSHVFHVNLSTQHCELVHLPHQEEKLHAVLQVDDNALWVAQDGVLRHYDIGLSKVLFETKSPVNNPELVVLDRDQDIIVYGDGMVWRFLRLAKQWALLAATEVSGQIQSNERPVFDVKTGHLYTLSGQGITDIDTASQGTIYQPPSVSFTSLEFNHHRYPLTSQNLRFSINFGEAIKLHYLALPLMPSKLVHFRYRFGADQPWVTIDQQDSLDLSQLEPNKYFLEMQASYDYQNYGESQVFHLTVFPPWWRTNLAYASYLVVSLSLLYLTLYWFRSRERVRAGELNNRVFENTSEGLCVLDEQFVITRINQALQNMTGWSIGENVRFLLDASDTSTDSLISINDFVRSEQIAWKGELNIDQPGKDYFFAKVTLDRLRGKNVGGRFILVVEDITERKQQEQHLIFLSRHDSLTQLPNRLFFDEFMAGILNNLNSPEEHYALMMLDLDDFKTINDSLGHQAGDLLLKKVARDLKKMILQAPFPEQSMVARHSGDEFIIFVKTTKEQESALQCWLLLLLIEITQKQEFQDIEVSASVGVTLFPDNAMNASALLQQADMALYAAKKEGKGRYSYYNASLEKTLHDGIEVEKTLMGKRQHKGLLLYYQPKVSSSTGKIIGFEALARWQLLSGEILGPGIFLPFLHNFKIDKLFGLRVINQAVIDMATLLSHKPDLKVSINLSPKYLNDPEYLEQLCGVIEEKKLPTNAFMFEILEDVGISNPQVLENLSIFRSRNMGISIDDFGTGYSNLSHLSQIGANELKIDRSFLANVPGDEMAEKLFQNVLDLGSRFNMEVICEGVETQQQLDFISACGCNCYQGYLFSPPVPIDEAINLIKRNEIDYQTL